eukprot:CAMPEP_0117452468 /NCGR_PEP_ID=MMETSP0759-20121206/9635_1 /TAXON_ID=63605 /ORGANISM="Percolomonas cosmopolitus, Strain WS" /LENGTH=48 /DNA_ID= /DNA_START= /DNA_END= /DNA_ORIENTATION=
MENKTTFTLQGVTPCPLLDERVYTMKYTTAGANIAPPPPESEEKSLAR